MEIIVFQVNSHVATHLLWSKEKYITELQDQHGYAFLRDKVHLSDMGDIFLQIAKGIVSILKNKSVQVSPRLGENVPWLRYDWLLIGHSFILLSSLILTIYRLLKVYDFYWQFDPHLIIFVLLSRLTLTEYPLVLSVAGGLNYKTTYQPERNVPRIISGKHIFW